MTVIDEVKSHYERLKDLPTKKVWTMYLRRMKSSKELNTRISSKGHLEKVALKKILVERREL